jgi:predicted nucleic acid-binding protein
MKEMRFADTNILLYAISTDPAEQEKARIALALLESRDLALSVQVLQEFYVQSTWTTREGRITHDQAVNLIRSFVLRFQVQETTVDLMESALKTAKRFGVSYWDAAIIEAARASGCKYVLSEDLSDLQDYNGVRVQNPFRDAPQQR